MDTYPTLKRPKKKLVYPTTLTRLPGQWTKDVITLEDVDKMFDDLVDSNVEDFPSPSPEIHITKKNKHVEVTPLPPPKELLKSQMTSRGDHKQCHLSANPELEIDCETPFKAHGPVKTSSPIEGKAGNEQKQPEDNSALPILFDCENENEGLDMAETPTEKCQHESSEKIESDESLFETLPKKPALDKMSAKKQKSVQIRPSNPPPSPERRNESKLTAAPVKSSECGHDSSKVKHNMTSFLQKLRDAGQPKPGPAKISQAKVVAPVPEPEHEDDFLILEDDVPFFVSIPSKYSKSMKEKRTTTSSSDTEAKDTVGEGHSADKQQDFEQKHPEHQTLTVKTDKMTRKKSSESSSAASDKDHPVVATVESVTAKNLSKKSQTKPKKTQSKDDKPEDTNKERDDGICSNLVMKVDKTIGKRSKTVKNDKGFEKTKRSSAKQNRNGIRKADALNGVEVQNQEVNTECPLDSDVPVSEVNNVETEPKEQKVHSSQEETTDEEVVQGKRKRKQPGDWWISCPQNSEQQATEKQPTVRETKIANKGSNLSVTPVKAAIRERRKNLKQSSSSDSQKEKAQKKEVKKRKPKSKGPVKTTSSVESDENFGQLIHDSALDQDSESSPLLLLHRERSISSGEKVFHKVFQNCTSKTKSSLPACASPMSPEGVLGSREAIKRMRKSPGNWWQVNPTSEDQEVASLPQNKLSQKLKKTKAERQKKKQTKAKPPVRSPSKPQEGGPKLEERSSANFNKVLLSPLLNENVKKPKTVKTPSSDIEADHNVVSIQMDKLRKAQQSPSQDTVPENMSRVIRSGPSSMIGLENYQEDEDFVLPSTTVQPALSTSDLCCAPLRPLILQQDDEVNLRDWLKSLWPAIDKNMISDIQPEHFEWYCHRGKAMGILVDLHTSSVCNGKMLLGSFMKKPLWVDHSAMTVFNLLTSSVSVVVDCNKSHYSAGQAFMVPPGHAYSIHNLNAQPAVLYFTRFFTDELDE